MSDPIGAPDPAGLNDHGTHCLREGRLAEATAHLKQAIQAAPDWFVPRYNLACACLAANNEPSAVAHLEQALALEPRFGRAHFELGTLLLAQGDFANGWREYDWRFDDGGAVPKRPGYDAPIWDGQPAPGGRLVIWSEQGLGDQIQFARFARLALDRGLDVSIQASPSLRRLFAHSFEGVTLLESDPDPHAVDFQIPLLSLPRLLGQDEAAIEGSAPYLHARRNDLPRKLPLSSPAGSASRVGLVWRGGDLYPGHAARNATPSDFAPLLNRPDFDSYALQFDATDQDRASCAALGVTDLGPELGDFATTAAIVDQLDLVITVDTAMAHLAGGLGTPTWLMLPHRADWRWQRDRDDTPWYPKTRLFRQSENGEWAPVIARMAASQPSHFR